ncbi:PAS domain-containing protein [Cyanobium sp. FGCU-6]|nr:PAS domain-containing protein [Cyanobium sp. FGCU6]
MPASITTPPSTWPADRFLLLPGDGLLLVRSSGEICHFDSTAREWMGPRTADCTGEALEAAWPELAERIERLGTALAGSGPLDLTVPRAGHPVAVRLFATDDGVGVGLLAPRGSRSEEDPRLLLLEAVLREVRDAVFVTSAEPIDVPGPLILFANPAALAQTGYALPEVLGRSPRLFQCDATDPKARRVLREAMRHWQPVRQKILNQRRNGRRFWVEIDIAPIADAHGWISHWVSVQRDCEPPL